MRHRASLPVAALLLVLLPAFLAPAAAQEEPPPPAEESPEEAPEPLLTLESVEVRAPEGRTLGPESLARLAVKISNRGGRIASSLVFTVSVAGRELPVYENQVFLKAIPAGETVDLALYNFWTGETGRPAPADGKLPVEVILREARWMEISEEDGVETWKPVGEVAGLPSSASTVVKLAESS